MGSLEEVKKHLLKEIQGRDVSGEVPQHPAFEVEDTKDHSNYVLDHDAEEGVVSLWDTSRNMATPALMSQFGPDEFPEGHKTSQDYYTFLYRKALNGIDEIFFIHYVNRQGFTPIQPTE